VKGNPEEVNKILKNPTVQINAPIVSNELVNSQTHIIWLEAAEIAREARPGQFVMLKCAGGAFLRRPLSLHRVSADKSRVAFLFSVIGKGTAWLAGSKPGEQLDLIGPLGNGFSIPANLREAVLIAGGLGVAPLGFLADELKKKGTKSKFLYGAASAGLLCPERFLPDCSDSIMATEDGSLGYKGYITECLSEHLKSSTSVYACGPTPMYRTLSEMSDLKEIPVQVTLEVRMACGLGVCYSCAIDTSSGLQRVCKHGPVFDLHQVLWNWIVDI